MRSERGGVSFGLLEVGPLVALDDCPSCDVDDVEEGWLAFCAHTTELAVSKTKIKLRI